MLKVGLTGGIGSGKTHIGKIFTHLGVPVFNADLEAKTILNTDVSVIKKIKELFGNGIYNEDGLNRKELASLIFNNKNELHKVNSIVHPKVHEYFHKWIEKNDRAKYVIEEAAILFESNAYKSMDVTINVHADKLIRIKRVVERDSASSEEVERRMKNQFSDEERLQLADFTIYNNDVKMVLPQVLEIHNNILKRFI